MDADNPSALNNPRIQKLCSADAEAIRNILLASEEAWGLPLWGLPQIRAAIDQGGGFGIVDVQGIVAFVLLQKLPDVCEILHLATHPRGRRKGHMAALLTALRGPAGGSCRAIWLEVHEANQPARQLYQKLGFLDVGRRPSYYSDGGAAILYNLG